MFYLIRHGEADYSQRNTKIYQGFGANLAPLSPRGIAQIKAAAGDQRLAGTDIILSSPYTRALQTAAILSRVLQADIAVETDLHEWIASRDYIFQTDERAEGSYREYVDLSGKYPDGAEMCWESREMLRNRALAVLAGYRQYKKVVVVCHGILIQAITGGAHPENGEIAEFELI